MQQITATVKSQGLKASALLTGFIRTVQQEMRLRNYSFWTIESYFGCLRSFITYPSTKGKKDRYTLLSDVVFGGLRRYYQAYRPRDYLFEGAEGRNHLSERSIQHVFERAIKAAGIRQDESLHNLRRSFAPHFPENGTDLGYIKEILGHASPKTTEIYTHVSNKSLSKIINPLDQAVKQLKTK